MAHNRLEVAKSKAAAQYEKAAAQYEKAAAEPPTQSFWGSRITLLWGGGKYDSPKNDCMGS